MSKSPRFSLSDVQRRMGELSAHLAAGTTVVLTRHKVEVAKIVPLKAEAVEEDVHPDLKLHEFIYIDGRRARNKHYDSVEAAARSAAHIEKMKARLEEQERTRPAFTPGTVPQAEIDELARTFSEKFNLGEAPDFVKKG